MKVAFFSLASVILVSLISLVGVFTLFIKTERLKNILLFMVSFSVGALFGDAFIHLLPESFERLGKNLITSLYIILGVLIFFVLEKFICWRHCHIPTSREHPHPVVFMNLVGDGLHNLFDGMVIAAGYLVSTTIGITTTLAVILHEIPQEIGDFGILVHGGLSRKKALFFNFLSAIVAIFGTLISLTIGPQVKNYSFILLPITAGGFIYMAGSDLIPELHKEVKLSKSLIQFISIVTGIAIMAILTVLD